MPARIEQVGDLIRIAEVAVEGSCPLSMAQGMFWPVSSSGWFSPAFGFVFVQIMPILWCSKQLYCNSNSELFSCLNDCFDQVKYCNREIKIAALVRLIRIVRLG